MYYLSIIYVIINLVLYFQQESNHSSTKSPRSKNRTSHSSSTSSPNSISRSPRSHHTRKHESHSDTKTSSSDEEKIKNHSRHRRLGIIN